MQDLRMHGKCLEMNSIRCNEGDCLVLFSMNPLSELCEKLCGLCVKVGFNAETAERVAEDAEQH